MGEAELPAIILGGGLGGLLSAIALRKVGIDAQVYEKQTSRGDSLGTLISIFPNGIKSLKTINPVIVDKLYKLGAKCTTTNVVDREGKVLKATHVDFAEQYGEPMVCVRWSRILDTFRELLPDDCVHTGYTFGGKVEEEEDGVRVFLEGPDGAETPVKGRVVIGADGVRSKLRGVILGADNVDPRDNGRTMWLNVMPRIHADEFPPLSSIVSFGEGQVVLSSDPGEGNMYTCFVVTDEASQGATKERSANGVETKERLLEFYKDWPVFARVIEEMNPEHILERRVTDLPELPAWRKGRMVLIGDAAHAVTPTIGQGANMTFEDALELARQLSQHAVVEEALAEFVALRKPRAATIVVGNQMAATATYTKGNNQAHHTRETLNDFIYNYDRNTMPLEAQEAS
eukprot:jgi/Mesen1/8656/ME000504S08099